MADTGNDWAADFFRDADSFQLPRLVSWFSDDIEVRFGNQPALHGKAAAEEAVATALDRATSWADPDPESRLEHVYA